MLSRNLASLRKTKQQSQSTLAEIVGVSRSTYAAYESGTSEPMASMLIKLANYFEVTVDELLRGDLDIPLFRKPIQIIRQPNRDMKILVITVDEQQRENIEFVSEAAAAGYLSEYNHPEFIEKLPHFRLPKLSNGSYRAFEVRGSSMPPMNNGYIIIGRFVEHEHHIKSGNRYVLVTKDKGIVFKKVFQNEGKRARQNIISFILSSDNPEFLSYTIDKSDILEIWEMVAFIGFPDIYDNYSFLLNDRLQLIEQELEDIKSR